MEWKLEFALIPARKWKAIILILPVRVLINYITYWKRLVHRKQMSRQTVLESIIARCEACFRFAQPPVRFRGALLTADKTLFVELSAYVMFLDGKSVLHVVGTAIRFSTAPFLYSNGSKHGQSVDQNWLVFITTFCPVYIGYPCQVWTDQSSVIASGWWRHLTDWNGFQLHLSGVKAHSALGIQER